ncbi:hypothetical protein RF11_12515 [Thelohanellus kitauei]|uniref:L-aminoadipate-semialdehyde dehydrogenase-phosphopantetheinyl transferase n=1 Tax=Thelohanellus kitauei TaxID=669202 RepID=A0A0C2JUV0_THEKT|nr:hypothetical protein RF11_12515 [Thelohanellus kitauei]
MRINEPDSNQPNKEYKKSQCVGVDMTISNEIYVDIIFDMEKIDINVGKLLRKYAISKHLGTKTKQRNHSDYSNKLIVDDDSKIFHSLSHEGGCCGITTSVNYPVGFDIVNLKRNINLEDLMIICRSSYSKQDYQWIASSESVEEFKTKALKIWNMKEAIGKLLGNGLVTVRDKTLTCFQVVSNGSNQCYSDFDGYFGMCLKVVTRFIDESHCFCLVTRDIDHLMFYEFFTYSAQEIEEYLDKSS